MDLLNRSFEGRCLSERPQKWPRTPTLSGSSQRRRICHPQNVALKGDSVRQGAHFSVSELTCHFGQFCGQLLTVWPRASFSGRKLIHSAELKSPRLPAELKSPRLPAELKGPRPRARKLRPNSCRNSRAQTAANCSQN